MLPSVALEHAVQIVGQAFRKAFGGKTILCVGRTSAAVASFFSRWGATPAFPKLVTTDGALSPVEELNRLQNLIQDPPSHFASALDDIDPLGSALIYAGSFVAASTCLGRRVVGGRRRAWYRAEEKDSQISWTGTQPQFLQKWSQSRTPEGLLQDCMAFGHACVVASGAPRSGLALGSQFTYIVPLCGSSFDLEREAALGLLATTCRGTRLSSFTRGIPVTYYGYVARRRWTAFGPCEALVFLNRGSLRIEAHGILVPGPDCDRSSRTPQLVIDGVLGRLTSATDYEGAFCIDGSISNGQLIVHEINPRICAGFRLLNSHVSDCLPANVIDLTLRERLVADVELFIEYVEVAFRDALGGRRLLLWEDPATEGRLNRDLPGVQSRRQMMDWRETVFSHFRSPQIVPLASFTAPDEHGTSVS